MRLGEKFDMEGYIGSMWDDKDSGDPGLSAMPRGGGVAERARGLLGPEGDGDPAGDDASIDGRVNEPIKLRTFSSSEPLLVSTSFRSDDRKVGAPPCAEISGLCCNGAEGNKAWFALDDSPV